MSAEVAIYTTPWCPFCHRAKALLSGKSVAFTEIDVDDRPDLRQWLRNVSGQRTVPQVFINNQPMGGFSEIADLDRQGKLDPLLSKAPSEKLPPLPR